MKGIKKNAVDHMIVYKNSVRSTEVIKIIVCIYFQLKSVYKIPVISCMRNVSALEIELKKEPLPPKKSVPSWDHKYKIKSE